MPAKDIANEYSRLFNSNNNRDSNRDGELKIVVDNFLKSHTEVGDISVRLSQITDYIAKLSNDNATGISGISNRLLKATIDTNVPVLIKLIFEKCINFGVTPRFFNISVLKPLIKDSSKETLSLSNLRPVAISDVLANMFESFLLDHLKLKYTDNEKQFGFKSFSSCSHAMFVVKQCIYATR